MSEAKIRRCPQCRREASWKDNPWKPFCSERCKMIDLGRWTTEQYRVPMSETPDNVTTDFDRETPTDENN
ncbi:MAG: DNA gyrase inhibitor YacG [Chloracidobacterium sp.]|nr:DNA gyrase inhibitor YacG [Chloracidobacterium sp.]